LALVSSPGRKGLKPYGERKIAATLDTVASSGKVISLNLAQALRTKAFWLLTLVFSLCVLCHQMVIVHIVPHVTDLGMPPMRAATILSLVGLSSVVGRVASGFVIDRIGCKRTLIMVLLVTLAAMLSLAWVKEIRFFYLLAVLFGLGYGGDIPLHPAIIGEYFGLKHHGTIFGAMLVFVCSGAALGPFLAGHVYDVTGEYQLAFFGAAMGMLVSVLIGPFLRQPSREWLR